MHWNKEKIMSKIVVILFFVLILELLPLVARASKDIKKEDDWGLGYRGQEEQPTGNVDAAYLKQYDAYYVGDSDEKVIYLTFDAGYENGYTEKLLDIMREQEVPATFFLVGHYLKQNPELVKRMVAEGHMVANHTYSHPDMTSLSYLENFRDELEGIETLYHEITGEKLKKFYRPPSGKYNEANLKNAQNLGYKTIFWSLAYVDWNNDKQPSQAYALSKLLPRIHPGAVVLLHSNSRTNSEILDQLITQWKKDGYVFKSLEDLVDGVSETEVEENPEEGFVFYE